MIKTGRRPTVSCATFAISIVVLLTSVNAQYTCDESKCRGERAHPWIKNDIEYTCWVAPPNDLTEEEYALLGINTTAILEASLLDPESGYCADGYVGRLVPSVAQKIVDDELRYWYTCCPIDSRYTQVNEEGDFEHAVYQTCSDSACSSPDWANGGNCWADGFQEPMSCGSQKFRHWRYTGMQSLIYAQFVCCDAPQENDPFMESVQRARILWMTFSSLSIVVCTGFVVAILISKQARFDGYNLYLVFLAIPDAVANVMILLRISLSLPNVPVSPSVFIFLASFEYFYAPANMWLNAIIVAHIHKVLSHPDKRVKIPPPSTRYVCTQAAVIYFMAAVVFGWAFYLYSRGLIDFSLTTVVNVWISTRAVMVGPPILYVLYICFDVWNRQLLPISGRTRVLALYFLRVIIVFFLTWVPYFILYEVAWNITYNRWMVYVSYYLGSIQGALSVFVALGKPDVKQAFLDLTFLLCCKSRDTTGMLGPKTPSPGNADGVELQGSSSSEVLAAVDAWYQDDVWATVDIEDMVGGSDQGGTIPPAAVTIKPAAATTKPLEEQNPRNLEKQKSFEPQQKNWTYEENDEWLKQWYEKRLRRVETASMHSGTNCSD